MQEFLLIVISMLLGLWQGLKKRTKRTIQNKRIRKKAFGKRK